MQKIELPQKPGWYAFNGLCRVGRGQFRLYQTLFLVEEMSFGELLGVRVASGKWRSLKYFVGHWWEITLPWE